MPLSTPFLPDTTIIAASAAEAASSTSPIKSSDPGVSNILTLQSSHSMGITLVLIDISLDISCLSKSLIVLPSDGLPGRVVIPARYAIASASDVLPHPECPNSATLRILSVVYTFIIFPPMKNNCYPSIIQ